METSWCSHLMKPPRHHFCVDFATEMAPNGTLGPIFGPKWLEMANYEQMRPFWAQLRDLDGKWDWFWYFLCVIWIEWDSFCYFLFWSGIAVNRLERPIFWSTLTKNADLGAYLAASGPNILTSFEWAKFGPDDIITFDGGMHSLAFLTGGFSIAITNSHSGASWNSISSLKWSCSLNLFSLVFSDCF